MQLVLYDNSCVALATAQRFWLIGDIDALPEGDPLKTWVCFLCLYARDVLTGRLPGPYSDANAEFFARCALMPERSFFDRRRLDDRQLARYFNAPLKQVAERRREIVRRVRPSR